MGYHSYKVKSGVEKKKEKKMTHEILNDRCKDVQETAPTGRWELPKLWARDVAEEASSALPYSRPQRPGVQVPVRQQSLRGAPACHQSPSVRAPAVTAARGSVDLPSVTAGHSPAERRSRRESTARRGPTSPHLSMALQGPSRKPPATSVRKGVCRRYQRLLKGLVHGDSS